MVCGGVYLIPTSSFYPHALFSSKEFSPQCCHSSRLQLLLFFLTQLPLASEANMSFGGCNLRSQKRQLTTLTDFALAPSHFFILTIAHSTLTLASTRLHAYSHSLSLFLY